MKLPLFFVFAFSVCTPSLDSLDSDDTTHASAPLYITLDELDDYNEIPIGTSSLVFVFDVTGSMYHDLLQVIDGAGKIVETILNRNEKFIYNYVLIPFHDPDIGPVTETTNSTLFLDGLKSLKVKGGGDCPEMSVTAIEKALDVSLPKSFIYVFTDATSKDYGKLNAVLSLIQRKESQIVFVLTGDCNDREQPGYQAYEKIASTSSGQIFHLDKQDVEEVLNFVRTSLETRKVNLLALDFETIVNIPLELPVDQNLKEFTLSVSGKNPQIQLVDPEGVISNETSYSTVLKLPNVEIVNVKNPSPGNWKVIIKSESPYSLRLTGLSLLDYAHGFSLSPTNNFFETYHRPLNGTINYLLINSTEPTFGKLTKVELVDLTGKLLNEFPLSPVEGYEGVYNASIFVPPTNYFYLKYHGINAAGYPFQRMSSTAISAIQPVIPDITVQAKLITYVNQPARLYCKIQSIIPFRAAWFRGHGKHHQLIDYINFNQSNEIVYTIPHALHADEDWYFCNASNIAGDTGRALFLDIKNPPPLILKPHNVTAVLGHKVELKCAISSVSNFNVSWNRIVFKNEKNKKITLRRVHHERRFVDMGNGSLWIHDVRHDDEGWYRCTAKNVDGTTHQILHTKVKEKLAIDQTNLNVNLEVMEGSDLNLSCPVIGSTPISISWYKNAKLRSDSDELHLKNVSNTDEGFYYCVAKNSVGEIDIGFNVTVLSVPHIHGSETVSKIVTRINEQTVFNCTTKGKPVPLFQWYRNGNEIQLTDATRFVKTVLNTSSLSIRNTQLPDEGRFSCVSTNRLGVSKREFQLQVLVPPYLANLEDSDLAQIAVIPQSVVINCSVIGSPIPAIKWQKNGQSLNISDNLKISDDGRLLQIISSKITDRGIYSCVAENIAGVLNTSFSVEIYVPLQFLNYKTNTSEIFSIEYESVALDCLLKDTNAKPTIVWLKKGQKFQPNDKFKFADEEQTLHIKNTSVSEEGYYTCIVSNLAGNIEKHFLLHVMIPSKIIDSHNDSNIIKANVNSPSTLECLIKGKPYPSISWLKDGEPFSVGEFIFSSNGVIIGNRISFESTQLSDSGNFTCVAENVAGKAIKELQLITLVPPQIEITPNERIINLNVNESINLNCNATGNPSPVVTWLKDGVLLDETPSLNGIIDINNETVSIKNAALKHSGTYVCIAFNEAAITEKDIILNILQKPTLMHKKSRKSIQGAVSRPQSLECFVDAYPKARITWTKDELPINVVRNGLIQISSNGQILHFLRPQSSDSGNYTCNATNAAGSTLNTITFDVWVKPTIESDSQLENEHEVLEGDVVNFECVVAGNPEPTLHWTKGGKIIDDGNDENIFFKNNKQILEISNMQVDYNGDYHCHATNLAGDDERVFQLRVLVPPKIIDFPPNETTVIAHDKFVLQCLAQSYPPAVITWLKNGQNVSPLANQKLYQITNDGLHIQSVSKHDAGQYTCVAANIAGTDERTTMLKIIEPAFIDDTNLISSVSVSESQLAILECPAVGSPEPSIVWSKDGETLPSDGSQRIHLSEDGRKLYFVTTQTRDAGKYHCTATNDYGSDSEVINLQILHSPILTRNFNSDNIIMAVVGENVTLFCDVDSVPPPLIIWFKNGKMLQTTSNNDNFHVILENVQPSDEGVYKCVARNMIGELAIEMELNVLVPPKIITPSEKTQVRVVVGQSATIECLAEGNPIPIISWYRQGIPLLAETGNTDWLPEIVGELSGEFSDENVDDRLISFEHFQKNTLTISPAITNKWKYKGQISAVSNLDQQLHNSELEEYSPLSFEQVAIVQSEHVLQIQNASIVNAGIYTCYAENDAGVDIKEFELTVLVPPKINTTPISLIRTVEESQSIKLECFATGTQPIRITWFKNYEVLKNDPALTFEENGQILILHLATVANSGVYTCIAENEAGKSDSVDITLIVTVPARIESIKLLDSLLVTQNESVTLECVASGVPPPQISWMKDGSSLSKNPNIIVNNELLKILRTATDDAGVYTCVAVNDYGVAEEFFQLEIFEIPRVKNGVGVQTTLTALLSESLLLDCPLQGFPKPVIQWYKGSKLIFANKKFELLKNGYQLWISVIEENDEGEYKCAAQNLVGVGEHIFNIEIVASPTFDYAGDDIVVLVNSELELICSSYGIPIPVINWSKDSASLPIANSLGSSRFYIARAKIEDSGNYMCTANNTIGTAEKNYIVNVYEAPKIKTSSTVSVLEVLAGQLLTLDCQATGFPTPRIIWYKNTQVILPEFYTNSRVFITEEKLKIVNSQITDSDNYTCVAKNPIGTATKNFDVLVSIIPEIEENQNTIRALEGSSITLKCSAQGWPKPNIQWSKTNHTLPSERFFIQPDNHLTIESLHIIDGGDYTCVAQNRAGIAKRHTTLDVFSYPKITKLNNETKLLNGSKGYIFCEVNGNPTPTVTWLKGKEQLENNSVHEIYNSGGLQFWKVEPNDSGDYTCVAQNEIGKASFTTKVQVLIPPTISIKPSKNPVLRKETLSILCEVIHGFPSPQLFLEYNSASLIANNTVDEEKNKLSVYIDNVDFIHAGSYACYAENDVGSGLAEVDIVVHETPVIEIDQERITVVAGQPIHLSCRSRGFPIPRVSWTRDGTNLDILQNSRINVTVLGDIYISYSKREDGGEYRCTATNIAGNSSFDYLVEIHSTPTITTLPDDKVVTFSQDISLTCAADGFPHPIIRWEHNGEVLLANDKITSTLTIKNVTKTNAGQYRCTASNDVGEQHAFATVVMKGPTTVSDSSSQSSNAIPNDAMLECILDEWDDPKILYLEKYEDIDDTNNRILLHDNNFNEFYLSMSVIDEGKCIIKNTFYSAPLKMMVLPKIVHIPDDTVSSIGGVVIFHCIAKGIPSPSIQWYKQKMKINANARIAVFSNNSLRIEKLTLEDQGKYSCVASNQIGSVLAEASLAIKENEDEWGEWSEWSVCSLSCGNGEQKRYRKCKSSTKCVGSDTETRLCNKIMCPIHGGWSSWSDWGPCSATCDMGNRKRTRKCNNPAPSHGGRSCMGSNVGEELCKLPQCVEIGKWSSWSSWTDCSVTCATGIRTRNRRCIVTGNAKKCIGKNTEIAQCKKQLCDEKEIVAAPAASSGKVLGLVNGKDLDISNLTIALTDIKEDRYFKASIDNLNPQTAKWFQTLLPIISPFYWTSGKESNGTSNGFTLTEGHFTQSSEITFSTGEILKMTHVARGVDKEGALQLDVVLSGNVPELPEYKNMIVEPFQEDYIQTGPDSLYGYSTASFRANGFMLPLFWNHSISYDAIRGTMPNRIQHLLVENVVIEYDEAKKKVNFMFSTKIKKAPEAAGCPAGFQSNPDNVYCQDDNECLNSTLCHQDCLNSIGSYTCSCRLGFTRSFDGYSCEDINECAMTTAACSWGKKCRNLYGSFECIEMCDPGFHISLNGKECIDIDECSQPYAKCDHQCVNTAGSFYCTCDPGFQLISGSICKDIDECYELFHNCIASEECVNTDGSYYCRKFCGDGFELSSSGNCIDINECERSGFNICPQDRVCINTQGSFRCLCPMGFEENEISEFCTDVNECDAADCQHGCKNSHGSFSCDCPLGYQLDDNGRTCVDVNECDEFACPNDQLCFNRRGSFDCIPAQCPRNYAYETHTGFCVYSCDSKDDRCPPNIKYTKAVTHKMVALPSGVEAYKEVAELIALDKKGNPLVYTTYTIMEIEKQPFRIRLENGKGILYTIQSLINEQNYVITVHGHSYDSSDLAMQYSTKFVVYVSVSRYSY